MLDNKNNTMNKNTYDKIEKGIVSLLMISFLLPFIFADSETVHYKALGMSETYTTPNVDLFWITVGMVTIFFLMEIWKSDLIGDK